MTALPFSTPATPTVQAPRSNGNGSDAVSGRGLAHRPFTARLAIAVAVATGQRPLDPSLGQIAMACRVSPAQLREAIKARANGNSPDTVTEVIAKGHLRTAVDEVGISKVIDFLSEIDAE
jgi:hypothetical protein